MGREEGAIRRRRSGRPRSGQEPLTREGILTAALGIVDRGGLEALSMRRLAAELGVNPMSIYHHLPGKEAVVSGIVGVVFSGMRVPPSEGLSWQERVRAYARAHRDVVRSHPNLALQIVSDAAAVSDAVLASAEPLYAALENAGLSPAGIVRAADSLVDFVHGFSLGEASNPSGTFDIGPELLVRIASRPPDEVPTLRRVFGTLGEEGARYDFDAAFDAGLDILVGGIEAVAREGSRRESDRAERSGMHGIRSSFVPRSDSDLQ
jgi:TetR/AcrR family transcriptional regulator, tetracycline repressor protein